MWTSLLLLGEGWRGCLDGSQSPIHLNRLCGHSNLVKKQIMIIRSCLYFSAHREYLDLRLCGAWLSAYEKPTNSSVRLIYVFVAICYSFPFSWLLKRRRALFSQDGENPDQRCEKKEDTASYIFLFLPLALLPLSVPSLLIFMSVSFPFVLPSSLLWWLLSLWLKWCCLWTNTKYKK